MQATFIHQVRIALSRKKHVHNHITLFALFKHSPAVEALHQCASTGKSSLTVPKCYCYIFGFGSIINTSTHSTWLKSDNSCKTLLGLLATFVGYKCGWTFHSKTGFIALSIQKTQHPTNINGALFQVPG
jgi:hypothetical protein